MSLLSIKPFVHTVELLTRRKASLHAYFMRGLNECLGLVHTYKARTNRCSYYLVDSFSLQSIKDITHTQGGLAWVLQYKYFQV